MKNVGLAMAVLVAVSVGWWLWPETSAAAPQVSRYEVVRGTVEAVISETGELAPRTPVPVQVPIGGRIEWLIDAGSWVDVGGEIAILNDDKALTDAAEKRGQLLNAEQEVALAVLKREQAETEEAQKVRAAERLVEVETFAWRVLTEQPQGEAMFLQLHTELQPKEAAAKQLRDAYEQALATYRQAEDAYLEAYDRWQDREDAILRLQGDIDEWQVTADTDPDPTDTKAGARRLEAVEKLQGARVKIKELRSHVPALAIERDRLQVERDRHRPALAEALAALEQAEGGLRDLHIRLEVEKRGLPLARLRIDEQIALLDLDEAEAALTTGAAAFAAGSISEFRLDELRSARTASANALAILRERIAIAQQPVPEEDLLEATSRLEKAQVSAAKARSKRDRILEGLDLDLAVKRNRVRKIRQELERMALNFPDVLRADLALLDSELAELPDDSDRRPQVEAEITSMRERLAAAEVAPPNVITAPVAGVIELAEKDRRIVQVGDEMRLREVIALIKTRSDMAVSIDINEADIDTVAVGQAASVRIPALPEATWSGSVAWIAGAGRDKFAPFDRYGATATAGVVEFPARVDLTVSDEAFRQGMTVLVDIVVDRREDVLILPRAAVQWGEDYTAMVLTPAGRRAITCEAVGDVAVVVIAGLNAGDVVLVEEGAR